MENTNPNNHLQNDLLQLDLLLQKAKDQGLDYLDNLSQRPTSTDNPDTGKQDLPDDGMGTLGALGQFNERFEPIMVAASGPKYWGFVIGGATPASIVGDWLTTVYDQNTYQTKGQGSIPAVIELEAVRLLLELFELPQDFLGGFVTGATLSNFTCLAVARQWFGKEMGKDFAKEGVSGKINILSATPHSSSLKSLSMLGIGSNNCIAVKMQEGREAIDIKDLEEKILALGGEPFILISSGGTVNTVDFDDFREIHKLRQRYDFWWHIDAAFGGFAICSKTHRHLLEDWENADSITIDCHKWLNVPYENAAFFVKEKHKDLQLETFQNSNAPYLGDPNANFSYLNFLPENSRRLRALPVWFTLMAYGKKGYHDIVENSIAMADRLGRLVSSSEAFELLAPVRLNTVCFTLKGKEGQEKVNAFVTALNDTQKIFMTPTVYNGQKGVRAAFVNWRTTEADVDMGFSLMNEIVSKM